MDVTIKISLSRLREDFDGEYRKHVVDSLNKAVKMVHETTTEEDTTQIDIDRIVTGISASHRSHILIIKEIIADLENKGGKTVPMEEIYKEANSKGIGDIKVKEVIERLKRSGDIFEPKRGFIQRV